MSGTRLWRIDGVTVAERRERATATIAEEIALVEAYLDVERVRLGCPEAVRWCGLQGGFESRARLEQRSAVAINRRIRATLEEPPPDPGAPKSDSPAHRFIVRADGRMRLIPLNDVAWIEADGHECILHCGR